LLVRLDARGEPLYRYVIADIRLQPERITLQGPETLMVGLDEIRTKPLVLDGVAESFKTEVALDLPVGIEMAPPAETILAEITLVPKVIQKSLAELTVQAIHARYPLRIEPATIQITVQGPVSVLETIDPARDIRIYLDLTGLAPGVYVRRAVIALPVQTTLVGASPELFTVTLAQEKEG
jgi:YbbR domain-containing protein